MAEKLNCHESGSGMTNNLPTFPAPEGSVWIYPGKVMHARFKPKVHRFNYTVFNLLIDLDQLDTANRQARLFSVGHFNLLSFFEKDHCIKADESARAQVDRLLKDAGVENKAARVLLLCYPRVLGFVFNPISVYFAYNKHNQPLALIYEVRNTFGQRHTYVVPVADDQVSEAGIRQERNKLFYVSPFMEMELRYFFRVLPPQDTVAIRILEKDAQGPMLAATFHGHKQEMSSANILRACLAMPLMTLKVVIGINFEALRLWLKGVRLQSRPAPPPLASFNDTGAPVSK